MAQHFVLCQGDKTWRLPRTIGRKECGTTKTNISRTAVSVFERTLGGALSVAVMRQKKSKKWSVDIRGRSGGSAQQIKENEELRLREGEILRVTLKSPWFGADRDKEVCFTVRKMASSSSSSASVPSPSRKAKRKFSSQAELTPPPTPPQKPPPQKRLRLDMGRSVDGPLTGVICTFVQSRTLGAARRDILMEQARKLGADVRPTPTTGRWPIELTHIVVDRHLDEQTLKKRMCPWKKDRIVTMVDPEWVMKCWKKKDAATAAKVDDFLWVGKPTRVSPARPEAAAAAPRIRTRTITTSKHFPDADNGGPPPPLSPVRPSRPPPAAAAAAAAPFSPEKQPVVPATLARMSDVDKAKLIQTNMSQFPKEWKHPTGSLTDEQLVMMLEPTATVDAYFEKWRRFFTSTGNQAMLERVPDGIRKLPRVKRQLQTYACYRASSRGLQGRKARRRGGEGEEDEEGEEDDKRDLKATVVERLKRLGHLKKQQMGPQMGSFHQRNYNLMASRLQKIPWPLTCAQDFERYVRYIAAQPKGDKYGGFGKGSIKKTILEMLNSGGAVPEKLRCAEADMQAKASIDLTRIWGLGNSMADKLVKHGGIRSLRALRERLGDITITSRSTVHAAPAARAFLKGVGLPDSERLLACITTVEDFERRIPRAEMVRLEAAIQAAIASLPGGDKCTVAAMGSYRRGKASSGDIDVLITSAQIPDKDIITPAVDALHARGLLKFDLAGPGEFEPGEAQTYMGFGRLPGSTGPWRRIDIKQYPACSANFARLYFTGSDHFNRSMRALAKRVGITLNDKYMTLAEYARPKGEGNYGWEKVNDFPWCRAILPTEFNSGGTVPGTEGEVFDFWGLPRKHPTQRNTKPRAAGDVEFTAEGTEFELET